MRIVVVTSPIVRSQLVQATAGRHACLDTPNQLWSRRPHPSDPDLLCLEHCCQLRGASTDRLRTYLRTHPNVAIIVVGELTSRLVRLATEVASHRTLEVALSDFASPPIGWQLLVRAVTLTIPERVYLELEPALARVPASIRQAVRAGLTGTVHMKDVPAMAAFAGYNARTVYRYLSSAGLESPKDLLRAARLMRKLPMILAREIALQHVATGAGYKEYQQFQAACRKFFGASPREIRFRSDPLLLPGQIARALRAA